MRAFAAVRMLALVHNIPSCALGYGISAWNSNYVLNTCVRLLVNVGKRMHQSTTETVFMHLAWHKYASTVTTFNGTW